MTLYRFTMKVETDHDALSVGAMLRDQLHALELGDNGNPDAWGTFHLVGASGMTVVQGEDPFGDYCAAHPCLNQSTAGDACGNCSHCLVAVDMIAEAVQRDEGAVAEAVAEAIAEYDRLVRRNGPEAIANVAADTGAPEVMWEVWEVADGMGYVLSDDEGNTADVDPTFRDALRHGAVAYVARLAAEVGA